MRTTPATTPLLGVLWDLDGTLIDTAGLWRSAEYSFLKQRGLQWADEHSDRLIGGNLELVSRIFKEVTGHQFEVAQLREEMAASVRCSVEANVPWKSGARELVKRFAHAGIRQTIVTSSYRDIASLVAQQLPGMDSDCLIAREDVVWPKPDSEPYQLAATRLDILPSGLVAIEDSGSGMASARGAGIPVLLVGAQGEPGQQIPGVQVLSGLSELASDISLEEALLMLNRKVVLRQA